MLANVNITAKDLNLNIGGTLTLDTKQTTEVIQGSGFSLGINIGPTGGSNGSGKRQPAISIGGSYTDISKTYTEDNTTLIGTNSSNIVASTIVDATNKKNTSYINGDFEGSLTIDLRLFTSKGREGIAKDLREMPKNLYDLSPMGANRFIEGYRGAAQSILWGKSAVYKSGEEPNGVLDPKANNVGQQIVPYLKDESGNIIKDSDGKPRVDYAKVGQPIKFFSLNASDKVAGEGGIISTGCNYGVPGCNDLSLTHDKFAGQLGKQYPNVDTLITNQGTIVPTYVFNTYGLIGKPINIMYDKVSE